MGFAVLRPCPLQGECMMNSDINKREDTNKQPHIIGPRTVDEITTSNATLSNSVPVAHDGMAGFDSRVGGNHLLLALEPGYTVIDKGMVEPQGASSADHQFDDPRPVGSRAERGRIHYALNHLRPTRVIELHRVK